MNARYRKQMRLRSRRGLSRRTPVLGPLRMVWSVEPCDTAGPEPAVLLKKLVGRRETTVDVRAGGLL
ncbi:hypothetical protein [Streptomyces canus]|uniref:hypothetical protein n=1 Tax=Streptomyces canus TaxID=58343 RepID=UPI0037F18342